MTASEQAVYRRILHRETHSSRSLAAIVVASLTALVLVGAIAAVVGSLLNLRMRDALSTAVAAVVTAVDGRSLLIVAGAVGVVLAVALIALAVAPGRRARRGRIALRVAMLVDDGVLADAAADAVAARCEVARAQVVVTMARRRAAVTVVPISGVPVDAASAKAAAAETLAAVGFPTPTTAVVAAHGVIA
ncbi:hypothetical protein [Microbacterium ulmi]|uniref:Uncharacterized protein n=1 Tax=Microbacterium ulmi TaxID=179095 RepID=A0A7Y2LXM0_9MICO|nr:hypothetical protein [Microbacterium ulmi]NII70696.1 hypothetical protein [Microbacterium ulmi]NNH02715.1 hypothetical protein [Microbacterium ulmi]